MVYKFLITLAVFIFMLIAGYYLYVFLNKRLRESRGILELLFYSIALFAGLGVLYFGGLFLVAKVYTFLMGTE